MKFTIPLLIFAAVVVLLSWGLRLDPTVVPSVFIGKPAPTFSGVALDDPKRSITRDDFLGRPALLSFWATWCAPCLEEHEFLMALAEENQVPIYGINYKDDLQAAHDWLEQEGNPYEISIYDGDGRVGMEWGVYAIPELFVIDGKGIVRQRFLWPVSKEAIHAVIDPLLDERSEDGADS